MVGLPRTAPQVGRWTYVRWGYSSFFGGGPFGGQAMMRRLLPLLAVVAITTAVPALAHHSEAAEFDQSQPVKVTGTITKVEWLNPHVWFYVDVKDEQGKVTTWGFSAAPPGALMRRGITKDALVIGAVVNVEGSRARDGSNNASGRSVTFADGRNVFTATNEVFGR